MTFCDREWLIKYKEKTHAFPPYLRETEEDILPGRCINHVNILPEHIPPNPVVFVSPLNAGLCWKYFYVMLVDSVQRAIETLPY